MGNATGKTRREGILKVPGLAQLALFMRGMEYPGYHTRTHTRHVRAGNSASGTVRNQQGGDNLMSSKTIEFRLSPSPFLAAARSARRGSLLLVVPAILRYAALTAKVRALGVEYILGDLEEAFWAYHRPVDVLGLDTPPLLEVKHS